MKHTGFVLIDGIACKVLAFRHISGNGSDPIDASHEFVEDLN